MKKVLALVLAVIMVCTMAMAVTLTTSVVPGGGTGAVAPTATYTRLTPGTKLIVHFENTVKFYNEGTGATAKFVPEKNTVLCALSRQVCRLRDGSAQYSFRAKLPSSSIEE